jgi:hypothetical protein
MKKYLLFILIVSGTGLYAQNITTQTLRWHVANTQEINTGRVSDDPDRIVSYGSTKIEWQNTSGVVKRTFTINETNGSWTSVLSNGSILYEVSEGERVGTIRIFRTSSELTIRITLLKGDEDPDLYELSIANLETL